MALEALSVHRSGRMTSLAVAYVLNSEPSRAHAAGLNNGDEGNEGNEGDEGNEGGFSTETGGSTSSGATCTAGASASAFNAAKDAHIVATAESLNLLCNENGDNIDVRVRHPYVDTHVACVVACMTSFSHEPHSPHICKRSVASTVCDPCAL